jgi:two-component sensor histidine kinase
LSNLVGNAIKFTPEGGRIDIDAVANGKDVLINVRDNGVGIPVDHLPFIFQRYWSIKKGNPLGNGLGLYISQGIIAAHGGHLWATSEPGRGSLFTFSLPAHAGVSQDGETTFLKQSGTTQRLAQSISTKLERQALEDRAARTVLLNELNHRVKNTLSTVQAIARLTASSADSVESFRKSFEARIFALSQAHDALARSEWVSTDLLELVELIRGANGEAAKVTFQGASVALEPRISLTLAMVLHELMANARQHGALASPGGRVTITAALDLAASPPILQVDWVETGSAALAATPQHGVGFRLIRRSIERELNGKAQVHFASSGLNCSMLIPWHKPEPGLI